MSKDVTNHNMSFVNQTYDVLSKGCYSANFDQIACIRIGILSVIIFVTSLICVHRVYKLHILGHPQPHQFLLFYIAIIETIILGVKWHTFHNHAQMEFAAIYLKLVQFIILCHSHWTVASRIFHRERFLSWFIIPSLVIFILFITSVCILGSIWPKSTWLECMEPEWLTLSISEFVSIQLFVIAGLFITSKINSVSALESFKSQQKRHLWGLIIAYEISGLYALIYDATIKFSGNNEIGCSGIYRHQQAVYSTTLSIYVIVRFLLPIWVMLAVYKPIRGHLTADEERLLSWTFDAPPNTSLDKSQPVIQNDYASNLGPSSPSSLASSYTSIARGSSLMSPGKRRYDHLSSVLRQKYNLDENFMPIPPSPPITVSKNYLQRAWDVFLKTFKRRRYYIEL